MNFEPLLQNAVNYGLGTVLALFMAVVLWKILMFVLKSNEKREAQYILLIQTIIQNNTSSIDKLGDTVKSRQLAVDQTFSQLTEANRFQREEHNSMIKVLTQLEEQIKNVCKSSIH